MSTDTAPIYVIGHKNPDTDSICSAIAYAELKNLLHGGGYVAARAGQINQETQYVMNFFQTQPPFYVSDVMTDVSDIEIRKTQGVSGQISLKKAWNMMRALGVVTLPITDNQRLQGLITIGDIANAYMDVYDNCILSVAKTPYKNILETLDAELLIGESDAVFDKGEVVIAAANPDVMEDYIHQGDMVILGNRYESQLCAIEMNAACIIVCMGAKVSKTIQKLAQEHNCSIIVTPHDTFTIARMINQSMPISHFMKKDGLVTFKVTEKTEDIRGIMGQKRYRDFPILDQDGNYIGMISRRNLLNLRKKRVILVDHNEASQTVDGIAYADILEIIDHHRLGTIQTMSPVFFRNQPLGCTATIIYQMYQEAGIKVEPKIAGLLCSAIVSDTLLFRSPTCTPVDEMAARALADIAGIDIEKYAMEMFSAGSNLKDKSDEEIFYQDFKRFTSGKVTIGVGQITSLNGGELDKLKGRMEAFMEKALENNGLNMIFFMLTNILTETTELICEGQGALQLAGKAFHQDIELLEEEGLKEPVLRLPGVVSRKKQLIPELMLAEQE